LAGLPVATEVANSDHVEACLKAGVDILWIGARTTVNPFSVQEIADSLKGVNIPVVIKNPLNPDLQLWIGAVERLRHAGIDQLAVLHRGFSFYGKSQYRNKPMWEIPIAMRTQFPEIPMLCDPSHINGKREGLGVIAQKAIDLGMGGLMIESHPCPAEALSDSQQQVIPSELSRLLKNLTWRREDVLDPVVISQLGKLRAEVDTLDEEIVRHLAARMELTDDIGKYKKEHGLTILQLDRWNDIVEIYNKALQQSDVSPTFIKFFLENLHKESIRRQTELMNHVKDQ
jgi:chorismate mutase